MERNAGLILLTGGSGFIGSRVKQNLLAQKIPYRSLARRKNGDADEYIADLVDPTNLTGACAGVATVFHCAGHAHAFSALNQKDAAKHWQINFEATRNLVMAAGRAGVQRFIFLSSVKAMADPGITCAEEDFPGQPATAYGQSKRAAEDAVLEAGIRYGMHVVNLRLTMVYGAKGRGNLERMGRMVRKGWFPPLPETGNHRSLIHVNDVVDAVRGVADDDRANGKTYIITGPEAPSGRMLYESMREVLGKPKIGWAIPERLLRMAAFCGDNMGKICQRRFPLNSEVVDRLLGSAWYSPARIERELGWKPQITLNEGLKEMFDIETRF